MFKFLQHILITCQWISSVCVQWKRWLVKRMREKIATSLQFPMVFLQKIHLKKNTGWYWGWDSRDNFQRWKFRKHIEKLLCFITDVKDRILGGEGDWVSGIFAVAELRTGLELVNNSTEHLCSPDMDVRSFLPSTGCSLLCYLIAVEVPHYLHQLSPAQAEWGSHPEEAAASFKS